VGGQAAPGQELQAPRPLSFEAGTLYGALNRLTSLGLALATLLMLTACGEGARHDTDAERRDPIDRPIARFLHHTLPKAASGTLVAARDGKLLHCQGFGLADRERRLAAGCDTVYDTMSMTKQFTAAAILKLEMMGRLRVSDPIADHIGLVPQGKREITVHHLLTHTSGLIDALGGDYEPVSRAVMLARALDSRLRSRPGEEYHYSNAGYSVLAAIVEQVSGMGYEEFLAEHLFAPSGMTQTGYVIPNWRPGRVAVEYDARRRPHGRPFQHRWAADGPYWNLRGNGGLLSTARDMFRWHVALRRGRVLSRSARRKLFKAHVREEPGGSSYYGYGWVMSESDRLGRVGWHNGGNRWSYGELTRLLDAGVMVFWVTNQYRDERDGWSFHRLGEKLTRGVVNRVDGGA
jgi:CubicO group peptidase (beta-lactamase class C family)